MNLTKTICLFLVLVASSATVSAEKIAGSDIQLDSRTGPLTLGDFRGKVLYLDFWASWCGPCRKSFPWMNAMYDKYADKGLVILAVNEDDHQTEADAFLRKIPASFLIAYDANNKLAETTSLEAMPSSFLIAKDGTIIKKHLGFKTGSTAEYEAAIRDALGLPPLK